MAILLAAMLAMSMAACSGGSNGGASSAPSGEPVSSEVSVPESSEESSEAAPAGADASAPAAAATGADTAENAVKLALDAFKAQDQEAFAKYVIDAETGALDQAEQMAGDAADLENILVQDFGYEIKDVKEDGESATVTAQITNVDLSTLFSDIFAWSMQMSVEKPEATEEEAQQLVAAKTAELLKATAGKTASASCDIVVTKGEGGWRMTLDELTADALYGGMISGMASALEEIMGQMGAAE